MWRAAILLGTQPQAPYQPYSLICLTRIHCVTLMHIRLPSTVSISVVSSRTLNRTTLTSTSAAHASAVHALARTVHTAAVSNDLQNAQASSNCNNQTVSTCVHCERGSRGPTCMCLDLATTPHAAGRKTSYQAEPLEQATT